MGQLILAGIAIIALKLVWDVYKEYSGDAKTKPKKGQVIDLSEAWIDMDNLPYQKKGSLLSRSELALFHLLIEVINPESFVVLPKVRLEDIISSTPNVHNAEEYLHRLKERSADFIICSLPDLEPQVVVICDNLIDSRIKQLGDKFNKKASEEAGLAVITINTADLPSHPELTLLLRGVGID